MEKTGIENQVNNFVQETGFDALSIDEKLEKMRQLSPEAVSLLLARNPELVEPIRALLISSKEALGGIISSDDASLNHFYSAADKELENDALSRKQMVDCAQKVLSDINKCMDNPSEKECNDIMSQEIEVLKMVFDKDTEIRNHETEVLQNIDRKDVDKRQFDWKIIERASYALLFGLSAIAGYKAGRNIKFPKKPK